MQQITSIGTWQVRHLVSMDTSTGPGNPSSTTVQFAFLASTADPQSGDWKTGSWEATPAGGWVALCLVGPGGGAVTLAKGSYYVWIKISGTAETPIGQVGQLVVI